MEDKRTDPTVEKAILADRGNPQDIEARGLRFAISPAVLAAISDFIGGYPAERGGILGCDPDGVIRHFEPDPTARCGAGAYDPDNEKMNHVIKCWREDDIEFCGFAHSHPPGVRTLSAHDEWYAAKILAAFEKLDRLWLPVVMTVPDSGHLELIPYAVIPSERDRTQCCIAKATLDVVDGQAVTVVPERFGKVPNVFSWKRLCTASESGRGCADSTPTHEGPETLATDPASGGRYYHGHFKCLWRHSEFNPSRPPDNATAIPRDEVFASLRTQKAAERLRDRYLSRVTTACDVRLLDRTRLVFIGTGGAASLVRNSSRMGFGEFILIDPDIVTSTNIATQQALPEAIGVFKVEALARDIVSINPAAAVLAIAERIEDIEDEHFRLLFKEALRGEGLKATELGTEAGPRSFRFSLAERLPRQTILLVLTDCFLAQARGQRLGLNFGLPTICAQEYVEGRGAEITYTVPGVTPACHRCITASRYRAYLQQKYRNDVTSEGAPIFAAEFLNAALGHILLAVAHHESKHPRWSGMVMRLGNRNLIRIRMDPDFDEHFGKTFGKRHAGARGAECLFALDSLFLPQTPDRGQSESRPTCPDCGGSGDLRDAIGTFADTRELRRESKADSVGMAVRQTPVHRHSTARSCACKKGSGAQSKKEDPPHASVH